jgi:hypothetical protein
MLICLILSPAGEHRSGANQMSELDPENETGS